MSTPHPDPTGPAPSAPSRSPSATLMVTLVLAAGAVTGVALLLKSRPGPCMPPAPPIEEQQRPELEPTGSAELDRLLREAQESIRGAEATLHRAEERSRRVDADLAAAVLKKSAADRAKAEFDASVAAMRDAPTPANPR